MKSLKKLLRPALLVFITCLLALAACANTENASMSSAPTETSAQETIPTETTAPETEPTTEPTTAPTEPDPVEYTLSFAGDCCLANLKGWPESQYFIGTVGDNYEYPFAAVQEYFGNDDCTFINLECALTESNSSANKSFVFKGPTAYNQILTAGSVEFANIVNNHSKDYGQTGYDDTAAALDAVGVHYVDQRETVVFTTESGLTLGVYADLYPEDIDGLEDKITAMREAGAEVIIVCMHWGQEYYYKPNTTQQTLGHAAIDAGADIVYGHHSHILQPIEEYNGKYIYYSLGNFSFGGNTNPTDKDTAILQQTIIREPDGSVHLGELKIIPCSLSSSSNINDFQPVPYEEGSEEYERVMSKLDGSFPMTKLSVSYRPELD